MCYRRLRVALSVLCTGITLGVAAVAGAEQTNRDLPMQMVNFRLTDSYNQVHELEAYREKELIVLFSQLNGCPIVRQSFPYMREIRQKYESKGVAFLYFNSSDYDAEPDINHEADEYKVVEPILKDWGQVLAHALEVERSAETFVVDPKTWTILYRGMADDRFDYGLQRSNPQKFWLADTLEAHFTGKEPQIRKTIAKGCLLPVDLPQDVTYEADVAKILDQKLGTCVPGANGSSWSALTEEQAKEHAQFIREVLLTRRVPKNAGCDASGNDLEFTVPEIHTILAWYYAVTGGHSEWFNAG